MTVNNMIYITQSEARLGAQFTDSATAAPDGAGGTLITVHVNLPQGITQAHVVSSYTATRSVHRLTEQVAQR